MPHAGFALPNLDEVGKSLILPQLDVPCFVDSYRRPVRFWVEVEEWMEEVGRGKVWGGGWEERRGETCQYVK